MQEVDSNSDCNAEAHGDAEMHVNTAHFMHFLALPSIFARLHFFDLQRAVFKFTEISTFHGLPYRSRLLFGLHFPVTEHQGNMNYEKSQGSYRLVL